MLISVSVIFSVHAIYDKVLTFTFNECDDCDPSFFTHWGFSNPYYPKKKYTVNNKCFLRILKRVRLKMVFIFYIQLDWFFN